jgi:hypothetical protein
MITKSSFYWFTAISLLGAASTTAGCAYDDPDAGDAALSSASAAATRVIEDAPAPAPAFSCSTPGVNCGLTWVKRAHNNATGQDTVTCHDTTTTPSTSCDPYVGDTDCRETRRILCIRQDGSASNGFVGSFYNGWAAGNLGLTHGVVGSSLTSLAVADAACVAELGVGWRMAEHHDGGGGWAWTAYGNLNDIFTSSHPSHTLKDRFWVHINDQPGSPTALDGGNCWD